MMGKPEIIGFEHDPESLWPVDAPYEWTTDTTTGRETFTRGGYPFYGMDDTNRVAVWKRFGFRPVYKTRNFHARYETGRSKGWLSVTCRTCNQTTATHTGYLPHDVAMRHALEDCPLRHILRKPPQYLIDEF